MLLLDSDGFLSTQGFVLGKVEVLGHPRQKTIRDLTKNRQTCFFSNDRPTFFLTRPL